MSDQRAQRGREAELRAAAFLEAKGYQIAELNFRCRLGELDLIAYDGDCLVFVEVRSRKDARFGDALAAVGHRKQAQVAKVAEVYLVQKKLMPRRCRFDVVGVTGEKVEHIEDAFRP